MPIQNRNLDDLTEDMAKRVRWWLDECKRLMPEKILVTETKRTKFLQLYYWSKGRYVDPLLEKQYLGYDSPYITPRGKIHNSQITWTLKSNHLKGEAIDFAFVNSDGVVHYKGDWEKVYEIAERCGLSSLFKATGYDRPHLNFNHNWKPFDENKLKMISDNEKILAQRSKKLQAALHEYNAVIAALSKLKGVEYRAFRVSR